MNELMAVIAEFGEKLHPDRITAIATKIETMSSIEEFDHSKSGFGPNADKDMIDRLLKAWSKASDVSPRDVAFSLRGASANACLRDKKESVELVWTGPSTGLVPVRHTEQVLCEVIDSAKRQLFIVSFVAYQVDSIISALRRAIDRKVQIEVLFENSSEHGGRINHDSASVLRELLSKVNIYTWSSGKKAGRDCLGAVHAKCALADGELAFITSANLTKAAMEINMEAGVLVKGGDLPARLQDHLNALIATKIVERVNENVEQ